MKFFYTNVRAWGASEGAEVTPVEQKLMGRVEVHLKGIPDHAHNSDSHEGIAVRTDMNILRRPAAQAKRSEPPLVYIFLGSVFKFTYIQIRSGRG